MIKDAELREIFFVESNECVDCLDKGLLTLEKRPDDVETLKEMFRQAHSLKGSARMLGQSNLVRVAHIFEDMLGLATKGKLMFTPEIVDGLSKGLTGMRLLVREAVEDNAADVDVDALVKELANLNAPEKVFLEKEQESPAPSEQLDLHPSDPTETKVSSQPKDGTETPDIQETHPSPGQQQNPKGVPPPSLSFSEPIDGVKGSGQGFQVDTIRVKPKSLDRLIHQVSELAVTRTRLRRRLSDANEIMDLWQDLEKMLYAAMDVGTEQNNGQELGQNFAQLLQNLQHNLYEDLSPLYRWSPCLTRR